MYFKLNPTDSLAHLDKNNFTKGVKLLASPNDFYTLLIKKKIKNKSELKVLWGDELSVSELENKISTIDLFAGQDSYWVYNVEKIKNLDISEFVLWADKLSIDIILHFKSLRKTTKLKKLDSLDYLEVEDFKFWESGKIHHFLEGLLNSKFSFDLKKYLDTLSFDSIAEIHQFLEQLKNYYTSLDQISEDDLIKFDQALETKVFRFLDYFEKKQISEFYDEIHEIFQKNRVSDIFKIVNFLKSSLYKVADEQYLKHKARLTNYELSLKKIKNSTTAIEISSWVKQLSKLEINLKKNNDEFARYLTELKLS